MLAKKLHFSPLCLFWWETTLIREKTIIYPRLVPKGEQSPLGNVPSSWQGSSLPTQGLLPPMAKCLKPGEMEAALI